MLCKTTIGKGNKGELRIRLVLTAKGEILFNLSGDYWALLDSWYSGEHRDTGKIFCSPSNKLSLSRRKKYTKNNYSKSTEHLRGTENTNKTPWENPLLLSAPFQQPGKFGEGQRQQGRLRSEEEGKAGILHIRISRKKDQRDGKVWRTQGRSKNCLGQQEEWTSWTANGLDATFPKIGARRGPTREAGGSARQRHGQQWPQKSLPTLLHSTVSSLTC